MKLRTLFDFGGPFLLWSLGLVLLLFAAGPAHGAEATVTLRWTAPADDSNFVTSGRALQYDVRYSTALPDTNSPATWWGSAIQATGEPVPGLAGSTDTTSVALSPGLWWFNIRTADEVPNWSSWSNWLNVLIAAPDTIPPAPVRDLRVVVWPNPTSDGRFSSESGGE